MDELKRLRREMSRTTDPFAAEAYLNRIKEVQNGMGSRESE